MTTATEAVVELPLNAIDLVADIYPREHVDSSRVELFAEMMSDDPNALPPVEAVRQATDDGERYILVDGRHRLEASRMIGRRTVPAKVLQAPAGTDLMKLAYLRALETCTASSLPLRASERVTAVRRLLEMSPGLSDREIARVVGVSHSTVAKYRQRATGGKLRGPSSADRDRSDRDRSDNDRHSGALAKKAVRSLLDLMDLRSYDSRVVGAYLNGAVEAEGLDSWDWWDDMRDMVNYHSREACQARAAR